MTAVSEGSATTRFCSTRCSIRVLKAEEAERQKQLLALARRESRERKGRVELAKLEAAFSILDSNSPIWGSLIGR